tara:strand:- start:254 stop:526 length:273 start_codon:yes stop_codon:yes gene_type:complete
MQTIIRHQQMLTPPGIPKIKPEGDVNQRNLQTTKPRHGPSPGKEEGKPDQETTAPDRDHHKQKSTLIQAAVRPQRRIKIDGLFVSVAHAP